MFEYTQAQFSQRYQAIKQKLTMGMYSNASPTAYILGGQPGAGKSSLQAFIMKSNPNCIIINVKSSPIDRGAFIFDITLQEQGCLSCGGDIPE